MPIYAEAGRRGSCNAREAQATTSAESTTWARTNFEVSRISGTILGYSQDYSVLRYSKGDLVLGNYRFVCLRTVGGVELWGFGHQPQVQWLPGYACTPAQKGSVAPAPGGQDLKLAVVGGAGR